MAEIEIARPFLGEEEWQALREPIQDGWLTQGPRVAQFESAFAERHGVRHAIAVTSCTTGLHLVLVALGIGPGDEVIVPAFTWVATSNAVAYCGATPVFVDVDAISYNLDPSKLVPAINPRTKAVVAVHLFGLCADMSAITAVLPEGVAVVEDAACAAGAAYQGKPAGSLGRAGVFSFHPRKVITTGEGGMITTSDDELAALLRRLRNHGARVAEEDRHRGPMPWSLPEFDDLGFNYRMTDLQGAVGNVQLSRLDSLVAQRRVIADWYRGALADISWLQLPVVTPSGNKHTWQSYVSVIDGDAAPGPRDELMRRLHEKGIATRPGTHAPPGLGWYRTNLGTSVNDFPIAAHLARSSIALPMHNHISKPDMERIVDEIGKL